jgi:hypothetical protein
MKEFCNKISLVRLENVLSVSGSLVTLKTGASFDDLYTDSAVTLDVDASVGDGGSYFQYTIKGISEKLSPTLRARYPNASKVVVRLYTDTAETFLFGTPEFPSRIFITPVLNRDSIEISLKAPASAHSL